MILAGVQGTALDDQAKQMIADQKVGGIIFYGNNVTTLQGTADFVQSIKEANRDNPVPLHECGSGGWQSQPNAG